MGQEFGHVLAGSSASFSQKAVVKVLARTIISSEDSAGQ